MGSGLPTTSTAPSSLLFHPISAPSLPPFARLLSPQLPWFSGPLALLCVCRQAPYHILHCNACSSCPHYYREGHQAFTKVCSLDCHSAQAVRKQQRSRNLFDAPCRSLYSRRGRGGESEREIGCSVVPHSPLVKVLSRGGHMRRLAV